LRWASALLSASGMAEPEAPVEAAAPAPAEAAEAEIKFVIEPEGFSHSRKFPLTKTVGEVKKCVDEDLRIPAENMKLTFKGTELTNDADALADCGLVTSQVNEMKLHIVYLDSGAPAATAYTMPDVISVEVHFGADIPPKLIQVPIVRAMPSKKPFLGGFRSKKTHCEYHHAVTQTDRPPRDPEADALIPKKFHREAQTAVLLSRSQQAVREQGTQMATSHLTVDGERDTVLRPMPYFTSEELEALRLAKTIDLQRYTRGWFARTAAEMLRQQQREEDEENARLAEEARLEAEAKHKSEIERRMHPQTPEDFEILYNELEAWRLQETKRIQEADLTEEERCAENQALLLKQQKLLQTIDRLRLQAAEENRDKRVRSSLQSMAAPKRWQMSDGEVAQVHTPFTTRAKELMELYNGLRLPLLSIDERLDVLLHVKWTVKEFDCNLTRDIVELIDREADMLNRGRSESSLAGLRKRLANLFLQFVETPEFNPEAARFQKVPQELVLRPNVRPIEGAGSLKA